MTKPNDSISNMKNMGASTGQPELPWYKHPWVWLIISFPLMAVVMGLTTVYFAVNDKDTLVRDNYYKYGRGINRELGLETRAKELEIKAEVTLDNQTGVVMVNASANEGLPETLQLIILHPTQDEKDQDLTLRKMEDGRYTATVNAPLKGRYHLQLKSEEQNWVVKAYHDMGSRSSYSLP